MARLPIMIDSSKLSVVEAGLQSLPGKGVVNSLSLKDGEAAFLEAARRIPPLRRRRGGHGLRRDRPGGGRRPEDRDLRPRLPAAHRGRRVPARGPDLRPNVLAVATGIAEHDRYGVEFLRALPRIREACPGSLLSGGISNLSFAFRGNEGVRQAMNSGVLAPRHRRRSRPRDRERRAAAGVRPDSPRPEGAGRGCGPRPAPGRRGAACRGGRRRPRRRDRRTGRPRVAGGPRWRNGWRTP